MERKTYRFWQNNSGGFFDDMPTIAPSEGYVGEGENALYILANSPEEANKIAQSKGIYFDGVSLGTDCECCGDRWYRTYHHELEEK